MAVIVLALALVAGILGAIEIFRSRGQSLVAWGVEALALALLVPAIAAAAG